jgi:hypothetical protein
MTDRSATIRGHTLSRLCLILLPLLAVLLLAVPSAVASQTYFSGTMSAGGSATSGFNYWSQDTVYRPIGKTFALWFGSSAGYTTNSSSNPFSIFGSYGYNQAHCANLSGTSVSPVTCIAS